MRLLRLIAAAILSTMFWGALLIEPTLSQTRVQTDEILAVDHFVRVKSSVPSMVGQFAQIYVRERAKSVAVLRNPTLENRVVLFIHGAGTPAEVAFDVPFEDYSWMQFLANAGYDVFSMDTTGYGRSTRPTVMNDPCNLAPEQQRQFIPTLISAVCAPSYSQQLTTLASDWNDIDAVVDHIRRLRNVQKVSLVAWSLGGPRSGGYAALHPEKISRLVVLAPAYVRESPGEPPIKVPAEGAAMNTQSHAEFIANWDRQVGCSVQYEPEVADSIWKEMIDSDPVGATWGDGVRRAPLTTSWGWNASVVGKMTTPFLMISGIHDKQVPPERVQRLYDDLGSKDKVFVDLACSSHNAMWERNHMLLFKASEEWLSKGTVNGMKTGALKLGY